MAFGQFMALLDIQIVIDDSGSMKEEQANLASKLSALLTSIKDRNWRIHCDS